MFELPSNNERKETRQLKGHNDMKTEVWKIFQFEMVQKYNDRVNGGTLRIMTAFTHSGIAFITPVFSHGSSFVHKYMINNKSFCNIYFLLPFLFSPVLLFATHLCSKVIKCNESVHVSVFKVHYDSNMSGYMYTL